MLLDWLTGCKKVAKVPIKSLFQYLLSKRCLSTPTRGHALFGFPNPRVGVFEFMRAMMGAMNSGMHTWCVALAISSARATRMLWRRLLLLIDDALVWSRKLTSLPPAHHRSANPQLLGSLLRGGSTGTPVARGRNGLDYVIPHATVNCNRALPAKHGSNCIETLRNIC